MWRGIMIIKLPHGRDEDLIILVVILALYYYNYYNTFVIGAWGDGH